MTKHKKKERIMSESTQLFITEFMTEKNKLPEIKLVEIEDKNEIKLEFEEKEKDKN